MTDTQSCPNVTFLMRLHKLNKAGVTARDAMILYAIMTHPGTNGNDVTKTIGMQDRSSLQLGFQRLERLGFIEDRRERASKAVPTIFYATPAGKEFWQALVSNEGESNGQMG